MSFYLGIDEAGRGSVLGPLVVGVVLWDTERAWDGPKLDDSKKLSPEQRRESYDHLKNWTMVSTQHIPPWVIDRSDHSLPFLEALVLCNVIQAFPEAPIRSDALSNGDRIHNFLRDRFPDRSMEFEPGADERVLGVGAASIAAKVERDRALRLLEDRHGKLGSGYPGDVHTREWIDQFEPETGSWPNFVRTSWSTIQRRQTSESVNPPAEELTP